MMYRLSMLSAATLIALPAAAQEFERGARNTDFDPAFDAQFRAPLIDSGVDLARDTVAGNLEHPWGLAVLPDGRGYLVSERPGRLVHVRADGTVSDPLDGVPEVVARKQGGLLDVQLGPDFAQTRRVYMTYAKPVGDGLNATAAGYGRLAKDMDRIEGFTDIFVQAPGSTAPMHFGSRIVFDTDGHAFVTTGEHFTQEYRGFAQDLDKTYGKVIRVTRNGDVPADNPFIGQAGAVNTIWSSGHRNIQGATMKDGALWTIEHGPQGGDELNRPEAGRNYGWPVVSYGEQYGGGQIGSGQASGEDFAEPVYFWDPVIAPGDMTVYDGDMFDDWQGDFLISALVCGGLVRLEMQDGQVVAEESLLRDLGRVRDVEVDDDGSILVLTDYEDGALMRLTPSMQGDG